jgi:hypothetical protein
MAVAHDAGNESHTGIVGSASEASFTFSNPGTASARAAIVFVLTLLGSAKDTSVTYGGVGMTLFGTGIDTDTEPGTVRAYFLDNVATGTQSIVVNRTNDATVMYAVSATVTAAGACEVYSAGMITQGGSSQNTGADTTGSTTGAFAEVSVDDGSPGTNSLRYAFGYYGGASPPPAGASSTLLFGIDFTALGANFVRETTAGQGARLVGFNNATADDRAAVYVAIRETPAAQAANPPYRNPMIQILAI